MKTAERNAILVLVVHMDGCDALQVDWNMLLPM